MDAALPRGERRGETAETGIPSPLTQVLSGQRTRRLLGQIPRHTEAFINLKTGRQLHVGNRFGNLTAIRYPAPHNAPELERTPDKIDPAQLGCIPAGPRPGARRGAAHGLAIGFSFFFLIAAALLMALLFVFNLEQRSEEAGAPARGWLAAGGVKRVFLLEGIAVAMLERRRAYWAASFTQTRAVRPRERLANCGEYHVLSISRSAVNVDDRRPCWCVGRDRGDVACHARPGASPSCAIAGERR